MVGKDKNLNTAIQEDRLSTDEFQDHENEDGDEKGAVMEFSYEQSNDYKLK